MKWLTDIVGFIVPVVTIIGSLLGILIALDQITAASRLRRRAVFWRDMAAQSHALPRDVEVFHSLEREAHAKVIALQLHPARKLLWSGMMFVVIIAMTAGLGYTVGQIPSSELTWETGWNKATDETGIPFYLVSPSLMAIATMNVVNLSLLRSRIAKAYLDGRDLKMSIVNRADRSPVDALGWKGFFGITAFSLGLTIVPAGIGGLAGASAHIPATTPSWAVLFVTAGLPLLLLTGTSLHMQLQDRSSFEWQHPRPLPQQPRSTRSRKASATSQRVHPRRFSRRQPAR